MVELCHGEGSSNLKQVMFILDALAVALHPKLRIDCLHKGEESDQGRPCGTGGSPWDGAASHGMAVHDRHRARAAQEFGGHPFISYNILGGELPDADVWYCISDAGSEVPKALL